MVCFPGAFVYCYNYQSSFPFLLWADCDGHSSHKVSIVDRFGAGIPSDVTTAFGTGMSSWPMYFVKENILYKSIPGTDNYHGVMATGYPKPLQDEFPYHLCDDSSISEEQSTGAYVLFKGTEHYQIQNGNSFNHRGTMCGSAPPAPVTSCTDPTPSQTSSNTCSGGKSPINVVAVQWLPQSDIIYFTQTNAFYICGDLNANIHSQHGDSSQCDGPHNIAGHVQLDHAGDFTTVPDAIVGMVHSDILQTKVYILKGKI